MANMLRFNGSCIEVPTSGESRAEPSFEARVQTSGVFIARIKRAGSRSKQLGWTELFLLDSEKLALCSDSSMEPDADTSERFLLFPVFDGSSFRQVKRHGHALTLMAPSFSIVLEAEAGDDLAATQASKWGRIIQRLATADQSRSSTYFKGLGISLNNLTAKPQRSKPGRKQLVPVQPSQQNVMHEPENRAAPKHAFAPPPSQPTRGIVGTQDFGARQYTAAPTTRNLPGSSQPTNIPRSTSSKSAKRLSLGLAKPGAFALDMGFGDDLKGILGALEPVISVDEQEEEPRITEVTDTKDKPEATETSQSASDVPEQETKTHPDQSQQGQPKKKTDDSLSAPQAPFSDSNSLTPSPNSLYLTQNASPSDSSIISNHGLGKELNRMESILVKEQQQQLDRYGTRAATISSFDLSLPPKPKTSSSGASTDSSPSSSNPPPGIPPPVPEEHPVRTVKRVSIAQTSPVVQYIPPEESDSDNDQEQDKDIGAPPSPEPEPIRPEPILRKKNPGIVKAVKKLLSKRRTPKEHRREFKGPMELLREQEEQQRKDYELSRLQSPPAEENVTVEEADNEIVEHEPEEEPRRITAAGSWRTLAMVEEEPENEKSPVPPSSTQESDLADEDPRQVAQAVAPAAQSHSTSAVPKLNSQSSISALSFRSMRSQPSVSSGLSSEAPLKQEAPKAEPPKVVARLDPKQDSSWQKLVEQQFKAPAPAPAPAAAAPKPNPTPAPPAAPAPSVTSHKPATVAPVSLDPGRFTVPDRTTNPIIRKVFESGNNKSTPALSKADGLHSASSSYSSFGSFKRSAPSYGSQASSLSSMSYSNSASSISAPNLVSPQKPGALEVTIFGTNLWVSKWVGTKWTPLSQLELRTDVVVTSSGVRILVMNPGGVGCIPLRFSPQCEVRRVSAHDTEVKLPDNTYMFRGRDPENSQKFFRTLAALQADGVPANAGVIPPVVSVDQDRDDTFDYRRRTLVPPVLSRNSYAPKYMGMSTSTIVEE